jgi:hypothetical protein
MRHPRPASQRHAVVTNYRAAPAEDHMAKPSQDTNWSAVIARCLAYLCLKNSERFDGSKLEQSDFLEKLGLPIDDRAGIIGTTPDSLRELARQSRKKKGG